MYSGSLGEVGGWRRTGIYNVRRGEERERKRAFDVVRCHVIWARRKKKTKKVRGKTKRKMREKRRMEKIGKRQPLC